MTSPTSDAAGANAADADAAGADDIGDKDLGSDDIVGEDLGAATKCKGMAIESANALCDIPYVLIGAHDPYRASNPKNWRLCHIPERRGLS